jgi:hypothetical protein
MCLQTNDIVPRIATPLCNADTNLGRLRGARPRLSQWWKFSRKSGRCVCGNSHKIEEVVPPARAAIPSFERSMKDFSRPRMAGLFLGAKLFYRAPTHRRW